MRSIFAVRETASQSTIDSEGFKGGTHGSPIMPRDQVSRTAHVGLDNSNRLLIDLLSQPIGNHNFADTVTSRALQKLNANGPQDKSSAEHHCHMFSKGLRTRRNLVLATWNWKQKLSRIDRIKANI